MKCPNIRPNTGTTVEAVINPIRDANMTIQEINNKVPSPATAENVKETFVKYHGQYWADMPTDVAQGVADLMNKAESRYDSYYPVPSISVNNMTTYGWTTHGHTAEDVPLWSYGPGRPVGTFDNTELAKIAAKALGLTLNGTAAWTEHPDSVLGKYKRYR
jgi:alkaline phosphatase